MEIQSNSSVQLYNGVQIPYLGLGVYQAPAGKVTEEAVLTALAAGYRHIDTASIYQNEASVGVAIARSGIPREEIFVTTKLWNNDHGYDQTLKACEASLNRLGLDYLDLYLMHWPVRDLRLVSWRAMETLLEQGKCRAIGVSNFMTRHLEELQAHSRYLPMVNQIELSAYNFAYRQSEIDFCRQAGIILEAYSPLTRGARLKDPKLIQMANKYQKTPAQILLRWLIEERIVVLPKSVQRERIETNGALHHFVLEPEDHAAILAWNENLITCWDPTHAP